MLMMLMMMKWTLQVKSAGTKKAVQKKNLPEKMIR